MTVAEDLTQPMRPCVHGGGCVERTAAVLHAGMSPAAASTYTTLLTQHRCSECLRPVCYRHAQQHRCEKGANDDG